MISVRRAGDLDAYGMAELLNEIVGRSSTTASTETVSRDTMRGWFQKAPDQSVWHICEDTSGALLGFQSIEPHPDLPPEACDIATFVRPGQTGLGVGSRLFAATVQAARHLGYQWINATIQAENTGGLSYYQSRGFEDYARHPNVQTGKGMVVDRISKRYDLG